MVLPQHLVHLDAVIELGRARAKGGNKSEELECLSLLEEEGSIDRVYKNVLLSLLTMDTDVVIAQRKKAVALGKRKREDCSVGRRDGRGKARFSEKNKVRKETRVVRRRNLVKKEKQCKINNGDQMGNRCVYEKSGPRGRRVKIEREALGVANNRLHRKNTEENRALIQYQSENVAQAQSDEMYTKQIGGIFQGVVKLEDEVDVKPVVEENELRNQDSVRRNCSKDVGRVILGNNGLASKAIKMEPDHSVENRSPIEGTYSQAIKIEPDDFVESRSPTEGISSQTRNVKSTKRSTTFKNRDTNYLEGRDRSSRSTVPEVEILDSNMVVNKGIANPFISARILNRSMADEEAQELALESSLAEFRKELLGVLRKPYDKEEHQKSRKIVQEGFYLTHHPDMHKKLKKYRYRREKCLIVLRGFLFWLQNLTREGSFKPWKDEQCMKVKLDP